LGGLVHLYGYTGNITHRPQGGEGAMTVPAGWTNARRVTIVLGESSWTFDECGVAVDSVQGVAEVVERTSGRILATAPLHLVMVEWAEGSESATADGALFGR